MINKNNKKIDDESDSSQMKMCQNFIRGNQVYILGDFDKTISVNIIPNLIELINTMSFAKSPEIEFYINSYGGFAHELLGLLSVIQMAKTQGIKIKTYNIGCAYSCGSLLAIVGDERYMYRYADNLPHLGQVNICSQTIEQLERGTNHAIDWFSTIVELYVNHTKMPKKTLLKVLKDDNYHMNAEECIKNGFCDVII